MNEKYVKKLPQWYKDNDMKDLVLSNDIDSLIATMILQKVKNWKIGYFYDFYNIYLSDNIKNKEKKSATRVWVDTAVLRQEMCFDNHISRLNKDDHINAKCINPNLIAGVTAENYTRKYAGSTALMLWSLYGLPLPKTEEGKMLLLCIDTTFKGYYDARFRGANEFYLKQMFGFDELYEVQARHDKHEFYQLISKYNLAGHIEIDAEGRLVTDMDLFIIGSLLGLRLQLPDEEFKVWHSFRQATIPISKMGNSIKDINPRVFTLAFTYATAAKYSVAVS